MKIHCLKCGKIVSSEISDNTVIRAWVECPECIEKDSREAETPQQRVLTIPFYIGEEIYDDLTGERHKVIGISYELGYCDPDHTNVSSAGCWGIWIDSKYLNGGRHPWEITKFSEISSQGG